MNSSVLELRDLIMSGTPLTEIITFEEKRVDSYIEQLSIQMLKGATPYFWDINKGLHNKEVNIPDTSDPVKALDHVIKSKEKGFFVFHDLSNMVNSSHNITRKLREAYLSIKGMGKFIFMTSTEATLPDTLKKEITIIEFSLPDYDELQKLFTKFAESAKKSGKKVNLSETEEKQFITGVQGLTYDEATRALKKVFSLRNEIDATLIETINNEKKQLLMKEGVLEFFTHEFTMKDLGGVDNLKVWLNKREKAFTKDAEEFGLKKPRGILTMGISGCGKSLTAKIIATQWKLPLFRMDMNLVYSGMSGSPETVFSRALKTMDTVAPAVLWIDEIESGISDKQGDGSSSRILGYFLTWMQEHKSDIFIAATANRIDLLPAELLRRGRFDEIFFIDLPTHREREEIFTIHLKNRNNNIEDFNIPQLAQITKGWSGSEIEQVIVSGMFEAFNEDRKLSEDDLFVIFGQTVPLSQTMEEQIKKIRSWAHNRAAKASKDKEY